MKKTLTFALSASLVSASYAAPTADHLVLEATGKANGKHVVLLAGDEEYRSEESMPMLAQVLAAQGFKCSVLFSMDADGNVDPSNQKSLENSVSLNSADAIVMCIRFRNWEDTAMQHFEDALHRGVPIVALRTSTHAFQFPEDSKWAKYSWKAPKSTGWEKGFGRQVLGETWVNHHGRHKVEGTRSVIEPSNKNHPILNGVGTIFGTSDVYGANPLQPAEVLLRGAVTKSLAPDSPALKGKKNDPMQPIAWTREFKNANGATNKIFTTTMGAATDLADENLRRLVVNAVYWGLNEKVPTKVNVDLPGDWKPTPYSFNTFQKGMKPSDFLIQSKKTSTTTQRTTESEVTKTSAKLSIKKGDHITIIGAGMGSRMGKFNLFETELYLRNPEAKLTIRNMADEGNTPGFRPHPGRTYNDQYAFLGAEKLVPEELRTYTSPQGEFENPDQWLTRLKTDTIIAFFGFNSSFEGPQGLERYKKEFEAFLEHTLSQKYNGKSAPQLAVVSPTAFQNLSKVQNTPDGKKENANLALYTEAMREICAAHKVLFVDAFAESKAWYADGEKYTQDGVLLNKRAYTALAPFLADNIFGKATTDESLRTATHAAVNEKNWAWFNDFKVPNGVHVYGRRHKPFGPQNYPDEIKKTREMTLLRDRAIWATLAGKKFRLAEADATTHKLRPVETNYKSKSVNYLPGEKSKTNFTLAKGYKIELFASEEDFPNLANPVQMSFDNKGRLWVATMPSYPHYKIGDPRPTDKLIILEDTDNDGKADKEIVFAGDLHLPTGFEFAPEGVYVAQTDSLVLLKDTNGDDKYDQKEYILSGFDDYDTHHAVGAFSADPSGAIIMAEGVYHHTNVETAYGPVRGTNGGFFRYSPQRRKLTRHSQMHIPNPWGVVYDDYGQDFFLRTSDTGFAWMSPNTVKPRYGINMQAPTILTSNHVRPTSGLEIVSSRHFPDEVQGDILLNNNIGFLGTKQHQLIENGTGFTTKFRQNLIQSKDTNYRPVDLEFAPDGSLYITDWHNVLIGHMQHSARDPLRDHVHGRIYRITYPSRPLLTPAKIDGASVAQLLENLSVPEYRTRYRTRRELRGRDANEVLPQLVKWAAEQSDDRHKLEALWVSWGLDAVDQDLLKQLLKSEDHRVRSAAVRVLRFNTNVVENHLELLMAAANDSHGRVRLEAITAASWLDNKEAGLKITAAAKAKGLDGYSKQSHEFAEAVLNGVNVAHAVKGYEPPSTLNKDETPGFFRGKKIYHRGGHCATCHQDNGGGLPDAGFPPLAGSRWVTEDPDRLIKLTLHGLMGPIEVKGKKYPGTVPMTPFAGMLNDQEVADVLSYVRKSFGNKASSITAEQVKKIREATPKTQGFYTPAELLKAHPHAK